MTLNEPQCVHWLGHGVGVHAPGLKCSDADLAVCLHNLVLAHGVAVTALREKSTSDVNIGVVLCGKLCYPDVDTPKAREHAYEKTFSLKNDESWAMTHNIFMDAVMFHKYPDDAPEFINKWKQRIRG